MTIIILVVIAVVIFYLLGCKGEKEQICSSDMTKIIIQEILKSGYIDIWVYCDRVRFHHDIEICYCDYGYKNLNIKQTYVLAKEIMQALPNKELYKIQELRERDARSDAGIVSVMYALGDGITDATNCLVGYKVHNKNYDGRRYYKVLNKSTGKYDTWDCVERKWIQVQEKKKW